MNRHAHPRRHLLVLWGCVVACWTLLGCDVLVVAHDAPAPADTGLSEGGIIREDAGPRVDAPSFDAAAHDGGASLCASSCDPRGGAECLDALRCVLSGEEPACSDGFGELVAGAPCTDNAACAPGLACFRAGRTAGGVCGTVCCPGDGLTCADSRCGGDGVLADGTATAWGRCVPSRSCDVLSPELSCEAREGCYVIDSLGATECRLAGSVAAGETCSLPEDCGPGLFCGGLGPRTCLRICSLATGRSCATDQRCVAQTYSPEGTGICVSAI